jgi:hypothetical protein
MTHEEQAKGYKKQLIHTLSIRDCIKRKLDRVRHDLAMYVGAET